MSEVVFNLQELDLKILEDLTIKVTSDLAFAMLHQSLPSLGTRGLISQDCT